ncbi:MULTISPECIES: hypothetical protein [unclassified Bacillus (in: firmicutes)]|nr:MULTISPECIES: hypothetical protein [unclassified Bacillus (in: firmicutes)]
MQNKPLHFDGSFQMGSESDAGVTEPFVLTDEMRKNLAANPYGAVEEE